MTGHCSLCRGSDNEQRKTALYSNQRMWANKETNEEIKCYQLLISALKKVARVLTENNGGSVIHNEDKCYRKPGGVFMDWPRLQFRFPTAQPVFNFLRSFPGVV